MNLETAFAARRFHPRLARYTTFEGYTGRGEICHKLWNLGQEDAPPGSYHHGRGSFSKRCADVKTIRVERPFSGRSFVPYRQDPPGVDRS
jgi:hypothetical protein